MRHILILSLLILAFTISSASATKTFTSSEVPNSLKSWIPWVLHDIENNNCPFLYNNFNAKSCIWPTKLSLNLNSKGGTFSYTVTVYDMPDNKPQQVELPGNLDVWPQDVRIGKEGLSVLSKDESAAILLKHGNYIITGTFGWDNMPESIKMPSSIGLVNLLINGKEIAIPDLVNNQLLLKRNDVSGQSSQGNRVDVKLFRKVTDDIPLYLETYIKLQVAGKQREQELGNVLPEGFVPLDVISNLPARLEHSGILHVQLRPGTWEIRVLARKSDLAAAIKPPVRNGILPEQEIWSFEEQTPLRQAQVEGLNAIDPSQTEVPPEWKRFPAYLLKPGSSFKLVEKKRGMAESLPDQLSIAREIWLDFSGDSYTFRDTINGKINKSSRLEASDGVILGNATINGNNQYITVIKDDKKTSNPGVEVREGALNMQAGSRVESGSAKFSATGWGNTFDNVTAYLYLPPGWSLFSYNGADDASKSWINQWTLLEIFFAMLVAVAAYKLYNIRVAVLGFISIVLLQHELIYFSQFVLVILITIAALKFLPEGNLRRLVKIAQRLLFLVLLCLVLPFMVAHIRESIYPQLAGDSVASWGDSNKTFATVGSSLSEANNEPLNAGRYKDEDKSSRYLQKSSKEYISPAKSLSAPMAMPLPADGPNASGLRNDQLSVGQIDRVTAKKPISEGGGLIGSTDRGRVMQNSLNDLSSVPNQAVQNYQQYSQDTKLQTGFGNSTWRSNAVIFKWNGSVEPSENLSLYLISARENMLLAFVRIILMSWFIGVLMGLPLVKWRDKIFTRKSLYAALLVAGLSLITPSNATAITPVSPNEKLDSSSDRFFPPSVFLDELKHRFEEVGKEQPACSPICASVARTKINVQGNTLILLQEIHALGNVALPLPGGIANWRPSNVLVDDKPASGLMEHQDGYIYINLGYGVHHLKISGNLSADRDTIGISLPIVSHFTSVETKDWNVQGVHENGQTDNSIQLIRTEKNISGSEKLLEKTSIKPFYRIVRTYTLGQEWQVTTNVQRVTPAEEPAAVNIPLLPGETITSDHMQVEKGQVFVNFGPGEAMQSWDSVIKPSHSINLKSAVDVPWVEIWRFNVSNLWHVTTSGIPRVYLADSQAAAVNTAGNIGSFMQWQPWPGEELIVNVNRPVGVEGDTRTIDNSELSIVSSKRQMDYTLNLNLRSSLGDQHEIDLPEGAILQKVEKNGVVLPVQLKQNKLSLQISPGDNQFIITWKQGEALPIWFKVPAIMHGLKRSVNASTTITLPEDRWLIFTSGPQIGPVVLFWSWIPVILIISFILGKFQLTPLRMRHWFFLLLGLSQANMVANMVIIGWLFTLGWRYIVVKKPIQNWRFNVIQIFLVVLTLLSFRIFFASISIGLLGTPDMNIVGGNSYRNHLHWYQDITGAALSQPLVLSVSIWVYRGLMLLWSLWLAFSLVSWLRWGWRSFTADGYWRKFRTIRELFD